MDVAVTELRAHLSDWLERARSGSEVVITDRGVPVARLVGLDTAATLERLTAEGVIGRATRTRRPVASGRSGPDRGGRCPRLSASNVADAGDTRLLRLQRIRQAADRRTRKRTGSRAVGRMRRRAVQPPGLSRGPRRAGSRRPQPRPHRIRAGRGRTRLGRLLGRDPAGRTHPAVEQHAGSSPATTLCVAPTRSISPALWPSATRT